MDFIQGLCHDKVMALLTVLKHTALYEVISFRHQIALAIHHVSNYLKDLVSRRELGQTLSGLLLARSADAPEWPGFRICWNSRKCQVSVLWECLNKT
jgi:hypothetical protein